MNYVKQKLKQIGIDASIAYSSGGRIVQGLTGLGSIYFIGTFLSAQEQGYYFTFSSLLALQVFFELGLHNVITQFAAHENAHLTYDSDYNAMGPNEYASRLASILRLSTKIFAWISTLFWIVITIAGYYFFSHSSARIEDCHIDWMLPWILLSFLSSINLFLSPVYAIVMGLKRVKEISKIRFLQSIFMPLSVWLGLILGIKLYALALSSLVSVVIGLIYLNKQHIICQLKKIWKLQSSYTVSYKNEIFPLQWKVALSWVSGYFIYQLFNPILFQYVGAEVAGQMGMTMQVVNAIQAFAFSWMSTKIPIYSTYIAQRRYELLDILFQKTLKQMLSVCLVIIILFLVTLQYIDVFFPFRISNRFISGMPLYLLCECTVVEMGEFIAAKAQLTERTAYLNAIRDYKVETMVNARCTEITDKGAQVETPEGTKFLDADTVIIAVGTKSLEAERDRFIDTAFDVINVGDCICASSIVHAVHSGFDAGLTL